MNKKFVSFIFGFLLPFSAMALSVPELTAPVMDMAGVIGGQKSQILDQLIRQANSRGKVQLTILTLPSLDGEAIEAASIRITDHWKLGVKGKDNGVLFLIVPAEKKARIEVGQGLEGDIPDVIAKRILADVSRPYFKRGLYADGIIAGTLEILKKADPDFNPEGVARAPVQQPDSDEIPNWLHILIFLLILFVVIFGRGLGFIGFGGGFGGGGFGGGGGGWSGGGGGFSGGGSSDSW